MLALPGAATNTTTGEYRWCSASGTCQTQQNHVAYPWGTAPAAYRMNLVVLQGCATASSATVTNMAEVVHNWGAGTTIGFVADIQFALNTDDSGGWGDAWANTFWADLRNGASYSTALVNAANSVGGQYGYNTWVQYHRNGTPTSLYPAQYVDNYHGHPLD
jgi:hypothetical protein